MTVSASAPVAPSPAPAAQPVGTAEQQWQNALQGKEKRRQNFIINGSVQLFVQTQLNGQATKIKGIDDTD